MPDWIVLAEKAVAPVVTGASALVASALSFKRRLDEIEKEFASYKKAQDERFLAYTAAQKEQVENLKRAFRFELDDLKNTIEERLKEIRDEVRRHDQRFSSFRESSVDFAREVELARFIEEQQTKWAQIQRTLGQIEGMLKKLP